MTSKKEYDSTSLHRTGIVTRVGAVVLQSTGVDSVEVLVPATQNIRVSEEHRKPWACLTLSTRAPDVPERPRFNINIPISAFQSDVNIIPSVSVTAEGLFIAIGGSLLLHTGLRRMEE